MSKSVKFKNIKLGMLIPSGNALYRASYINHYHDKDGLLRVRITSYYFKGDTDRYERIHRWEGPGEENLFIDDNEYEDEKELEII
jgi:hypothetical protein